MRDGSATLSCIQETDKQSMLTLGSQSILDTMSAHLTGQGIDVARSHKCDASHQECINDVVKHHYLILFLQQKQIVANQPYSHSFINKQVTVRKTAHLAVQLVQDHKKIPFHISAHHSLSVADYAAALGSNSPD